MTVLHRFQCSVAHFSLPERLNNPFGYEPHPLCRMAAELVCAYLAQRGEWAAELARGKMFGVLIVRDEVGELGFVAAFSGNLAGENRHDYFVPPVYDMLHPDDFFRVGEAAISEMNREIERLEIDGRFVACRTRRDALQCDAAGELAQARARMNEAKGMRDALRTTHLDEQTQATLLLESQHEKAEYRRLKQSWAVRQEAVEAELRALEEPIACLRAERKVRSAALQRALFDRFELCNGRGEVANLSQIFAPTPQGWPPAGAGECAAPKLLQYALKEHLKPIALAEFWQGASPKGEVRHHGAFYSACRGKCGPILRYMLRGLDVEPEVSPASCTAEPELIWEDASLAVVIKPSGMLSVPGLSDARSVEEWFRIHTPQAEGPVVVHRLDMDTSGVLVLAKTKQAHQNLQAQFEARTVDKCYVALLDGVMAHSEGRIELPLRPDLYDRPRQVVDMVCGKEAVTEYEVVEVISGRTRIVFRPLTGRTHQLRVHAAHVDGLGIPIVGDVLYGAASVRLCLHAQRLSFDHPLTGVRLSFERAADF